MSVKKIFITLIIVVACVMIGALLLNVLLPNVATTLVDGIEDMISNATGMKFDFNANGNAGAKGNATLTGAQKGDTGDGINGAGVNGIEGF